MRRRVILAVALMVAALSPTQAVSSERVQSGDAFNMDVVGHTDLSRRGFNADVWAHEGYAYIGRWGFTDWSPGGEDRFCPTDHDGGVAVIDATDPAAPEQVADLAAPRGFH